MVKNDHGRVKKFVRTPWSSVSHLRITAYPNSGRRDGSFAITPLRSARLDGTSDLKLGAHLALSSFFFGLFGLTQLGPHALWRSGGARHSSRVATVLPTACGR